MSPVTLRSTTHPKSAKCSLDLLKEKRSPRVIVNMQKVKYIDSAGVASLVEGLKVSRDMKSTFALYGLSRTAREVLELTRLIKVFEVYNNEEDALRGGNTPGSCKVNSGQLRSAIPFGILAGPKSKWHSLIPSAPPQLQAWHM